MLEPQTLKVRFTEREAEMLMESRLSRVATVSPDGQPHIVPVGFEFDGSYIYFGGWNLAKSRKYRNIQQNCKVAFIVDDIVSVIPWHPRGIEIQGVAEILEENGRPYVRITPLRKISWGL